MMVLLFMALALLIWVQLTNLLSAAAQEHRLEIARSYRDLRLQHAPRWLLELWADAMPSMFHPGALRHVVVAIIFDRPAFRHQMAGLLSKVHTLPADQRQLHDKMDRHFAIVLATGSPFTMLSLSVYTLLRRKSIKLSSIIPHRDIRASMVL